MIDELKDGYYLPFYSEIDPIFHIFNSSVRHDHNMTLFRKTEKYVEIVHHWEFERISGIKHHDVAFYEKSDAVEFIDILLSEVSLTLNDMQEVIGLPELSTCDDYHSVKDIVNITYHSVCHLFSSMVMDTDIFHNQNIIALSFDAGSDYLVDKNAYKKNEFCGAISIKGDVEFFPIPSPGPYWYYLAQRYHIPEGTLMALAYATTARIKIESPVLADVYNLTDIIENINTLLDFSNYILSYPKEKIDEICSGYDERFTEKENKISMMMKFVQEASLECVNKVVGKILDNYNLDPKDTYISLSGGYALNCPTNTNIVHKFGFKGQLCCPCVNDSGIAIGMGLYYFFKKCQSFEFQFNTAYYGNADNNLKEAIEKFNLFVKNVHFGTDYAVDDIINEPVVWFDDRSEVGPRALGHRSILANPAKIESKNLLNIYKKREWWRPVAPIVLEEEREEWFKDSFPSAYMLNNFQIKEDKKAKVEAILHLDGSARVQTVTENDDKRIYSILKGIYEKTGIPIICNTSLNDKGEPIINKITEAFNFALRKGIRIVYVNGNRVELCNHNIYKEDKPLERERKYFKKNYGNDRLLSKWNPYQLDIAEMYIYKINEVLHNFDITLEKDVKALRKIISKYRNNYDLYGNTNIEYKEEGVNI